MVANDKFGTRCSDCLDEIITTFSEMKKDNHLICPQCGKVNVVDSEKYHLQRQVIIDKAFGKRPSDPNKN